MDAAELYAQYKTQEAVYRQAAESYRLEVERALADCGIQAEPPTARHKGPIELFKKQRRKRYANPWTDCPDLVGVRVVVPLSGQKYEVVQAIEASTSFTSVVIEDQAVGADPGALTYRGLHLHVDAGITNADGVPIRCEVQVRTLAEHSWAVTQHKYIYKKADALPDAIQRVFLRLLVLVEIFDEQLDSGVALVRSSPEFDRIQLVIEVEQAFEEQTGLLGDQELTRHFIEELEAAYALPAREFGGVLAKHRDAVLGALPSIMLEHGPEFAGFDPDTDWLATQPEMLLVLALLMDDQYALSTALANSDLYPAVEALALWTGHGGFVRG